MLIALGIVAAVGLGAAALWSRPASTSGAGGSGGGSSGGGAGASQPQPRPGGVPGGGVQPLPQVDTTSSDVLKGVGTGVSLAAAGVGVVKALVGTLAGTAATTATVAAGGGGGAAAAGGGTAAGAGGASAGVSLSVAGGFALAVVAVVGFVVLTIMSLVKEANSLALGAFGYLQGQLVTLANETSTGMFKFWTARGASDHQARALGRLTGFAVAVGYNRAALAYVVQGAKRATDPSGYFVTSTPEQHLGYYVARAMCLPDEAGYIYKPSPPPPPPPGWSGVWPPKPPLLQGGSWDRTLEEYVFLSSTRATDLADAGSLWTTELEGTCDFIGRAMRCKFHLHNLFGITGAVVAGQPGTNKSPTRIAVEEMVRYGMIGLGPPAQAPGSHPLGAEAIVIESFSLRGGECVHQLGGQLGWFFNESITGATAVRPWANT